MLANMPVDLIRVILIEFVNIDREQLAHLDTAHCNRSMRANFLAALPFIPMACTSEDTGSRVIDWIIQKHIPLFSLQVSLKHFKAFATCCRRKPKSLATVTKLSFRYDSLDQIDSADVVHLLAALPNLKDVDCSEWAVMTDHHFLQFYGLRSQLEVLNVTKCEKITPAALAFVVAKVGSNLKELHLSKGAVDDQALTFMASCCNKLHTLSASCDSPSNREKIELLCVKNAKTLRNLSLEGAALSKGMIEGITKACKGLTHITFATQTTSNEVSFLQTILKNSSLLQELVFDRTKLIILSNSHGKRTAELMRMRANRRTLLFDKDKDKNGRLDHIVETCAENHIAIRSYRANCEMTVSHLLQLVGYFGDSLRSLTINLHSEVDDTTVLFMLQHCPNLTELGLSAKQYSSRITDKSTCKIPLYCRNLTKLSLVLQGYRIKDCGLVAMLEGFRGQNQMLALHLTCDSYHSDTVITDRTLILLADVFMGLKELSVYSKGITKETLLELIVSRKLVLDKVHAPCEQWLAERLKEEKIDPMPNFKHLWDYQQP